MANAWTLQHGESGIAQLVLDLPDRSMNVFTVEVMRELDERLEEIRNESSIKVLFLRSAKKAFIAGADISVLRAIRDAADGEEKARLGQAVFSKLSELACTTVAVIHGVALGGGLEFTLACTHRIATDDSKTQLGLPEVQLGIIPGWGGTQRLPRLIGLEASLPIILTGKPVAAKKALRIGLADALVAHAFLDDAIASIGGELLRNKPPGRPRHAGFLQRARRGVLERNPLGRRILLAQARKGLMAKTRGQYPAPEAALDVLAYAAGPIEDGLAAEAREFGRLLVTPVSRNLVRLFFSREALKKERGVDKDVEIRKIKSTAVVGAGAMGGGIAWLFSHQDLPVRVKDVNWDAVAKAHATAADYYRQLVRIRRIKESEVALKMSRISGTTGYTGFANVDLAVEAVVEKMEVKQTVLSEMESVLGDDAILCSNTSSLSINEMAGGLERPERFVGLHFFNPVNRMPLVEVIPSDATSPGTIATLVAFAKQAGKTPIVVKDCPGFLVNRLLLPYINECVTMLQEGTSAEQIDRAMFEFGMPMGPLRLADEVGLDIGFEVCRVLESGYGSRMAVAILMQRLSGEDQTLGKKTGRGFYKYEGRRKSPNPRVESLVQAIQSETGQAPRDLDAGEIENRALGLMINEAARCLEESVVQNAEYLDMAMIMGTGFPAFRGGLMAYADTIGITPLVERLTRYHAEYGERYEPAALLQDMAQDGRLFRGDIEPDGSGDTPGSPGSEN